MADETITIRHRDGEVTIPGQRDWNVQRENGPDRGRPIDVALHAQVLIGYPIGVTILLRSDGSWVHWTTDFQSGNHYLHFAAGSGEGSPLTEAQRRTLARWWLG